MEGRAFVRSVERDDLCFVQGGEGRVDACLKGLLQNPRENFAIRLRRALQEKVDLVLLGVLLRCPWDRQP